MSDSSREHSAPTPANGDSRSDAVSRLRKEAKQLLKACREGDAAAWARVSARLTRLASLPEAAAREAIQLADIHQALAMERGHENWAALTHALETGGTVAERAERFLAAARDGDNERARRVLEEDRDVATFDAFTAATCSLPDPLAGFVARDPAIVHSTRGGKGWTPLMYLSMSAMHLRGPKFAAAAERCAGILLGAGADPNLGTGLAEDPQAHLPALFRAAMLGNVGVVRQLLKAGADPNDDESVYHAAEHDQRECLELLLAHGARLDGKPGSRWNNTPLYFLAGYNEGQPGTARATAGMRWLLEHGADPNKPSYERRDTPLITMTLNGRSTEALAMLLDHGADPNQARADGVTPYTAAVRAGHTAAVELLVARGARPDLKAEDEFFGACMRGETETARTLLARDPGLIDRLGTRREELPGFAAEHGSVGGVRVLAALGFDIAAEPQRHGTPLHRAAWRGHPDVVRLLIELGAPINPRDGTYGSSPIAWAAHGSRYCQSADDRYVAIVDALIDAGAQYEPSINHWKEPPENFATDPVKAKLIERGFVPKQ